MELNELQQKVVHDNDHLSVSEAEADVDAYRRVSIATEISPLTELVASATKSQLAPDDVLNEQPVVEARASIATIHDPIPSTSTSTTNSFTISTITRTLDIKFEDLSYSVKTGLLRRETKTILKAINGEFRAGELSAILGPSGAGKSTLLDLLSGYTPYRNGSVTINGCPIDMKRFRRQAAYIMQDDRLQPLLTVREAMYFSANLKIGEDLSTENKLIRIEGIIKAIGLDEAKKTLTGDLSGGQRKRLAIALELVNNPPVMFFDEPTTGLDSSMSLQCISLLKQLSNQGRTIICTIHQPSALIFELFDQLYAIADGQCIYSGAPRNLVSFLSEQGLKCSEFHNPSDFLLEISTNDYGVQNPRLVQKIDNGRNCNYRKNQTVPLGCSSSASNRCTPTNSSTKNNGNTTPSCSNGKTPNDNGGTSTSLTIQSKSNKNIQKLLPSNEKLSAIDEICEGATIKSSRKRGADKKPKKANFCVEKCCRRDERYSTSFVRQLGLLLHRTFLILKRDKTLTTMRFIIHCTMAPLIGLLYFNIGDEAEHVRDNLNYVFYSIMFLMFTAFSAMSVAFPLELPIITREHFNRWYSLRAYYIAMTLADVPIQLFCSLIYLAITYYMTSQPPQWYRFGLFVAICIMVCLVAQALGLLVGALFSVKYGAIFGPFFICPFLIFSGFFVRLTDAHPISHWLFHISFLKYALEGAALSIFGYDRPKMHCPETEFCFYVQPKKFLKDMDLQNGSFLKATIALTVMCFALRITAFYVMSFRIKHKR